MAIRVDEVEISLDEIHREMQYHPASSRDDAERKAAQALVLRQVLLHEANQARAALSTASDEPSEEEDLIANLLEDRIRIEDPDEEACRAYYERHRPSLTSPDLFEASHILFLAPPGDDDARARASQSAEETLALLAEDPTRFEDLARDRSDCSSATSGGSLGQLRSGDTVQDFEEALTALTPGQIRPQPLETRFGVHVVRLDEFEAGRPLPFEAVRDRIREYLREQLWRQRFHSYVLELASRRTIMGFDLASGCLVERT
jgi:peptidyl-prolyl cis-trans isomerase C